MELTGKDLEQYKQILFDTMKAFIAFCDENNLMYYMCAGSALGAIRHRGLIPWDDDIDVVMPRKDYNKLKELSYKLSKSEYELLHHDNCEGYYLAFMKFCNSNTTIWERKSNPCILGVYVDIFPLDEAEDEESAKILYSKYNRYFRDAYTSRLKNYSILLKKFQVKGLVLKLWHLLFHQYYLSRFNNLDKEASDVRGDHAIVYGGFYKFKGEYGLKSWYGDGTIVDFEDFKVRVPYNYEEYLVNLYGDYMTPPPPEKRLSHHDIYYVNLNRRMTIAEINSLRIKEDKPKIYNYE